MTYYYGLTILTLWFLTWIFLIILSLNFYVFIIGFVFSLIILVLAAKLDAVIGDRMEEKTNDN